MNNPNEVLLGSHGSSNFESTPENGSSVDFPAGIAVGRNSSGDPVLGASILIGVSMGAELSDASKISVCRSGNDIPLIVVADDLDSFDFAAAGKVVFVDHATGKGVSSVDVNAIATNAIYVSGVKDGIRKGETNIPCALINMSGGI